MVNRFTLLARSIHFRKYCLWSVGLLAGLLAGTLALKAALTERDLVKLTPHHLTASGAGQLQELRKLIDRDTQSALTTLTAHQFVVSLPGSREIRLLKVFNAAPFRFSVETRLAATGAWQPLAGFQQVDLSLLGDGWNLLLLSTPTNAGALRLTLQPVSGSSATGLQEIEFWGAGERAVVKNGESLLAALNGNSPPENGRQYDATPAQGSIGPLHEPGVTPDDPADNTFTFTLDQAPADFKRAWLSYELSGQGHWTAPVRSFNGAPPQGGVLLVPTAAGQQWLAQIEEISPDWLNAGENRVSFAVPEGMTTSFSVRTVRLLAEMENGGNFVAAVASNVTDSAGNKIAAINDGDPATGWRPFAGGTQGAGAAPVADALFDKPTQVEGLSLNLAAPLSGSISFSFLQNGTWVISGLPPITGREAGQGLSLHTLQSQGTVEGMRLHFSSNSPSPNLDVRELALTGSGVGATRDTPALHLTWPAAGEFRGRTAYIRGFLGMLDNGSGPARLTIGGRELGAFAESTTNGNGGFGVTVNKDDLGLQSQADAADWDVEVKAVYPDGQTLLRTIHLDHYQPPLTSQPGALLPVHHETVTPGQAKKIRHDESELDFSADAVEQEIDIAVKPLGERELPALDPGMSNVTRGARRGYRFLPHGARFKNKITLHLPYDVRLIPAGLNTADIRTYYFDQMAGRWIALERRAINTQSATITSATDHFTDMINATVTLPDHPNPVSFNPTQISGIKAANPAAGITVIQLSGGGNKGDANLVFPIDIPAGRRGYQPDLKLVYNSSGGNGWMGMGWDIPTSAITVDTRWGTPRYDLYRESETYLLDGEEIAQIKHRGVLAVSTNQVFNRLRRVTNFETILKGNIVITRTEAYFTVNHKNSSTSLYALSNHPHSAYEPNSILSDPETGNIFKWGITEHVSPFGLQNISYRYDHASGGGTTGDPQPWRQMYLANIKYTNYRQNFNLMPGPYEIRFIRRGNRPDVIVSTRPGFKTVTTDLLDHVDVIYHPPVGAEQIIRRYKFDYITGAYFKSLLSRVTQFGAGGDTELSHHDFVYHDDRTSPQFGPEQTISDLASVEGTGQVSQFPLSATARPTTSLGASQSDNSQAHLFIGIGLDPGKQSAIGGKFGSQSSGSTTRTLLLDMNGDGLSDQVYTDNTGAHFLPNTSGTDGSISFGPPVSIPLPGIGEESSITSTGGAEAYYSNVGVVVNNSNTETQGTRYFADVNGDGRTDLVSGTAVHYNRPAADGTPSFGTCPPTPRLGTSTYEIACSPTPLPYVNGTRTGGMLPPIDLTIQQQRLNDANLLDPVRKWIAPYTGTVTITGSVQLATPSQSTDSIRFAIQQNSAETFSIIIPDGDSSQYAFNRTLSVTMKDHIYFRVNSRMNGVGDQVLTNPLIQYTAVTNVPSLNQAELDENGLPRYTFRASTDFAFGGREVLVGLPFTGIAQLTLTFSKPQTSDDVTLLLLRNGQTSILADTGPASESGIAVNQTLNLTAGDQIGLRLESDSRIDWSSVSLALAKLTYSSVVINGHTLSVNGAGNPAYEYNLPYSATIYPALDDRPNPYTPYAPWLVPSSGTLRLEQVISLINPPADYDADITLTVKRRGAGLERLAKQIVHIENGQIIGLDRLSADISVNSGDLLFFTAAASRPDALSYITIANPSVSYQSGGTPSPQPGFETHLPLPATEPFGGGYRNWYFGEYNGNDANPTIINNSPLDVSRMQFPTDAASLKLFIGMAQFPAEGHWRLSDADAWIGPNGMSASRRSARKSYDFSQTAGASLGGGQGMTRQSSDDAQSQSLSIFDFGPGLTTGVGGSDVDFMDINGDSYPDVFGGGYVQVTQPGGALANFRLGLIGGLGRPRSSSSDMHNVTLGTTTARAVFSSKGRTSASGASGSGASNQSEQASYNVVNASVTATRGDMRTDWDLQDINGDGLPDLVIAGGGGLRIRLNLGHRNHNLSSSVGSYKFGPDEIWPSCNDAPRCNDLPPVTAIETSQSVSAGVDVGAGTPAIGGTDAIYSFGGGSNLVRSVSATEQLLMDLNGDGLTDWVRKPVSRDANDITSSEGVAQVRLNTGSGFGPVEDWRGLAGKPLRANTSVNQNSGAHFTYSIPIPTTPKTYLVINPGFYFGDSLGGSDAYFADLNGDGMPDQVFSNRQGELTVSLNLTSGRTNLLKHVALPLGGEIELNYRRKGGTQTDPHSRWILDSLITNDNHIGDGVDRQVTRFDYGTSHYDRTEREYYGFDSVTVESWDPADVDAAGNPISGQTPYRKATTTYATENYYLNGIINSQVTTDGQNRKFNEVLNEYETVPVGGADSTVPGYLDFSEPRNTRLKTRTENFYEGQGTPSKSHLLSYVSYDLKGNLTEYRDSGDAGTQDDIRVTAVYDTTNNKPNDIKVFNAGNQRLKHVTVQYEGSSQDIGTYQVLNATGVPINYASFEYFGGSASDPPQLIGMLKKSITGAQPYTVDYQYDPKTFTHITSATDSFGLTSTAEYDPRFGLPTLVTDASGAQTLTAYDAFGRVEKVYGPNEVTNGVPAATPTIQFDYHPDAATPWAHTKHLDPQHSGNFIETALFIDGLGRVIQTKKDTAEFTGENSTPEEMMTVSGCVTYDPFGRAATQRYPLTEPVGNPGVFNPACDTTTPSTTEYDVLDRATKVTIPDGTISTMAYGFGPDRDGITQHETTATDANGHVKKSYTNNRGLISAVKEYTGVDPLWTNYQYDPLGQITRVTDANGNQTKITYDILGRRTSINNPDAGLIEWTYQNHNPAPIAKITPALRLAGKRIFYDYDKNRLRRVVYPNATGNQYPQVHGDNLRNVQYDYGAATDPDLTVRGRLKTVHIGAYLNTQWQPPANPVFRADFTYDNLGNVATETKMFKVTEPVGAGTAAYATRYTYDTWGRMTNLDFPDNESLHYNYDEGGNLSGIIGFRSHNGIPNPAAHVYLDRLEYDKFGQRVFMEMGNGVRTIYAYDANTRRLNNLTAQSFTSGTIQDLLYTFDPVGNISQIQNSAPFPNPNQLGGPAVQNFSYDDLDRLTSASGTFQPAADLTHEYSLAMGYDAIHNITFKNQDGREIQSGTVVPGSARTYTNYYTYGGLAPHQPTEIGDPAFPTLRTLMDYDANGNHKTNVGITGPRPRDRAITRTLTWDEENRLLAVGPNFPTASSYQYDAGGERTIKRVAETDPNTGLDTSVNETVYVNPFYTIRNGAIPTKHIFAGSQRIASSIVTQVASPSWNPVAKDILDFRFGGFPGPRPIPTRIDTFFFHPDHLGSTGYTTDSTGKVYEHIEYFPFGESWVQEATSTENNTPYLFTGKELDQDTGLYYYGARYYDPRTSLWQSTDPADRFGPHSPSIGLNLYQYGLQNPLMYTDPDGRSEEPSILGFIKWQYNRWTNADVKAGNSVRQGLTMQPAQNSSDVSDAVGDIRNYAPLWNDKVADTAGTLTEYTVKGAQFAIENKALSVAVGTAGSLFAQSAARGKAFQAAVIKALNATENTATYATRIDGAIVKTIPDIVDFRGMTTIAENLSEIKDVRNISRTPQLRAQIQLAGELNLPYNLIVSPNTKSVSAPLQKAIKDIGGTIQRFDPATGTLSPFVSQ